MLVEDSMGYRMGGDLGAWPAAFGEVLELRMGGVPGLHGERVPRLEPHAGHSKPAAQVGR